MPLNPEVVRYLEAQAAAGPAPVEPSEMRSQRAEQMAVRVDDRRIVSQGGEIPVRIYTPPAAAAPRPVLVYFHGGGWVTGDLEVSDFQCRPLSRWAGCLIVHVNYRHAPEHVFPAALDDAYEGALWVEENAAGLGADPARIAVGGDSADGNLAAAVTLLPRERGAPHFVFQYLGCPILDGSMRLTSYTKNAAGFGLTAQTMAWYWDQYVPNKADRANPLASPLDTPDLSGLPPALVMTAEFDPLLDEGEAYAARLQQAGVAVELKRYDGLIHGFLGQTAEYDAAKLAMADLAASLRRVLFD